MRLSVILIAYHGDRWIPGCLESLPRASRDRLHLVLLDNTGNTCIDGLNLAAFDAEVHRLPRPMGFAEANNYGLVHAERLEEFVLFLNQDTLSEPGWIDSCIECMDNGPSTGAVSPLISNYRNEGWDPSFLACLPGKAIPPSDGKACFFNELAPAPALIVSREVLAQTGPFDPIYGSYYEDYDLCMRIRNLGYDIAFARDAVIRHFSGSTTDTPAKDRRRKQAIIRNRSIYELRKSGSPRLGFLLKSFLADFPRRLARGAAGTPSSQPPGVVIAAYRDLLALSPRLLSGEKDRRAWKEYLRDLGWEDVIKTSVSKA